MMDLSRKDFMVGTLAGAAALAVPRAIAEAKGEKMENEMNRVEPSEFVARPFAPFEKWYASPDDLHIVYIAEVLAVRRCR